MIHRYGIEDDGWSMERRAEKAEQRVAELEALNLALRKYVFVCSGARRNTFTEEDAESAGMTVEEYRWYTGMPACPLGCPVRERINDPGKR